MGAALLLPFAAAARGVAPAVRALSWTGTLETPTERGPNPAALRLRVEPFAAGEMRYRYADSAPETEQHLLVEAERGWSLSGGARSPLDPGRTAHLRAQFGLYSYLLDLALAPPARAPVHREHPGFPPIDFTLDAAGRPSEARYAIPSDGALAAVDRVRFEGTVRDRGVAWPQRITFMARIWPSIRVTIDQFTVEPA